MSSAPEPTAASCPPPTQQHVSFLKRIGHLGLECVTGVLPFITREAQKVEPVIDLLFPLQGGIFTSVVNSVCLAEVAGAQTQGNGAVKLQAVWASVGPELTALAQQSGLEGDSAETTARNYIEAIITILNGPAKTASATASSSTSSQSK